MKYIDLFAGCGGLSLGLEQAGFELALAVEKSDMAAETFYHNFIKPLDTKEEWASFCSKTPAEQAREKVVVGELRSVLDNDAIMESLVEQDIALIAGGPPCQGFSMAGRRNPADKRNQLPWQFLEMVERISPKAVIMENVVGMRQRFEKHGEDAPFEQLQAALGSLDSVGGGYEVQPVQLNAMHFGAPQHRPRVMLIALRKDIAKKAGITTASNVWRSEFDNTNVEALGDRPQLAPKGEFFDETILTVRDALWDVGPNNYAVGPSSKRYESKKNWFAKEMRGLGERNDTGILPNQRLRNHSEKIEQRFRIYQVLQQHSISSKILNIPSDKELSQQEKSKAITKELRGVSFPCKSPDGAVVAKSARELRGLILSLGTRKHSQRPLSGDSPAPTVLSLPDDFVHPWEPRTMTVREMARFQTFPDSFEFRSKETTGSHRRRFEVPQYTQVGNAVPPVMAKAVGATLIKAIEAASIPKTKPAKRA